MDETIIRRIIKLNLGRSLEYLLKMNLDMSSVRQIEGVLKVELGGRVAVRASHSGDSGKIWRDVDGSIKLPDDVVIVVALEAYNVI